MLIEHHPSPFD
jgi:hypothetical protein